MMNFTNHEVRLEHLNTRTENHGDEERLALDLKISFDLPNKSLDMLSPTLRKSLYDADETEDMVDADHTPHLRNPALGRLKWAGKWSPVLFVFLDPDEDEENDLSFHDAKLHKVSVLPQDGGTCSYEATVSVYPEDGSIGGALMDMLHAPGTRGTLEVSDEALAGEGDDDD
jgi:hypothetical protein